MLLTVGVDRRFDTPVLFIAFFNASCSSMLQMLIRYVAQSVDNVEVRSMKCFILTIGGKHGLTIQCFGAISVITYAQR